MGGEHVRMSNLVSYNRPKVACATDLRYESVLLDFLRLFLLVHGNLLARFLCRRRVHSDYVFTELVFSFELLPAVVAEKLLDVRVATKVKTNAPAY